MYYLYEAPGKERQLFRAHWVQGAKAQAVVYHVSRVEGREAADGSRAGMVTAIFRYHCLARVQTLGGGVCSKSSRGLWTRTCCTKLFSSSQLAACCVRAQFGAAPHTVHAPESLFPLPMMIRRKENAAALQATINYIVKYKPEPASGAGVSAGQPRLARLRLFCHRCPCCGWCAAVSHSFQLGQPGTLLVPYEVSPDACM